MLILIHLKGIQKQIIMSNTYCIIMAGGVGSRFWPLSNDNRPKQFIDILGTGRTFLQQTFDRLSRIIPVENFVVVTCYRYFDMVMEQLPQLNKEQVLMEPFRRNTAPCIAYATYKIKAKDPNAVFVVAPSDHVILKEEEFLHQVKYGLDFAIENNALVTLGVKPNRPETGYGYIQVNKKVDFENLDNLYNVKLFTEKPNKEMASIFIETGEFYWNSGIFIWSAKSIVEALETYLENISSLFEKGLKYYGTPDETPFISKIYTECQSISIDYGLMEKAQNVFVLTSDFGWSDLGTWSTLYLNREKDEAGNVVSGDNILIYDTKNCIIDISNEKMAVLQGLDGYIIAESNDSIMICRRDDEQQIKKFVTDVRMKKGDRLL